MNAKKLLIKLFKITITLYLAITLVNLIGVVLLDGYFNQLRENFRYNGLSPFYGFLFDLVVATGSLLLFSVRTRFSLLNYKDNHVGYDPITEWFFILLPLATVLAMIHGFTFPDFRDLIVYLFEIF